MVSEKCPVLRGIITADSSAKLSLILVWVYFFDPGINYYRFLNLQVEFFCFCFVLKIFCLVIFRLCSESIVCKYVWNLLKFVLTNP